MAKLRVGIIFGGRSVEHEVSVASATSIVSSLDPARYEVLLLAMDADGRLHLGAPGTAPEAANEGVEVRLPTAPGAHDLLRARDGRSAGAVDVILPMIHGTGGEDGSLQGLLELADLAYVGAGVAGSAIQMDKEVSKRLLAAAGLPVVPWLTAHAHQIEAEAEAIAARAVERFGLPVFVKPASLGSSVGISKARSAEEIVAGLGEAARYDLKILVERFVDGREIEVGVLGNDAPEASLPGEILPKRDFYDYESKYVDEDTELSVPARLEDAQVSELRRLAVEAFRTLEGRGLARVDFFLDRGTGELLLNEVNSLPGFTEVSMFPRLWAATGLAYPALLDRLIELGLEAHRRRHALERTYRRG